MTMSRGLPLALREMCELSPRQLAARGRNARNSFSKRYDHEENAMTFLHLVERLRAGRKTMPVARRRAAD